MLFPPKNERELNRLFIGDALTTICGQLVLIAMPTYALLIIGLSAREASLLMTAQWIPPLLIGSVVGKSVDRYEKRLALSLAAIISAIGLGMVAFTSDLPLSLRFPFLLAASLFYALGELIFSVASAASVPSMIRKMPVSDAFAMQAGMRSTARVIGLAIAGPISQFAGALPSILFSGVVSLVRAGLVMSISPQNERGQKDPISSDGQNSQSAWRVSFENIVLRNLIIANFVMNCGSAIVLGAFFAFCYITLKLQPIHVGIMLLCGGCSAIITAYKTKSLMSKVPVAKLCAVSGMLASTSIWLIPASALGLALPTLIVYEVIFSAAATVFAITFSVVRQRMVSSKLLGQMVSISSITTAAAMVVGLGVSALLVSFVSLLQTTIWGCAASSIGVIYLLGMASSKAYSDESGCAKPGAN